MTVYIPYIEREYEEGDCIGTINVFEKLEDAKNFLDEFIKKYYKEDSGFPEHYSFGVCECEVKLRNKETK